MGHPDINLRERMQAAGVRPTARRVALAELLFATGPRHFTAEDAWRDAREAGLEVSLATIYNTLNQLLDAGIIRTVEVPGARGVFDTNTTPHHHLLDERTGELTDLPHHAVDVGLVEGALPEGTAVTSVDVLVRVRST